MSITVSNLLKNFCIVDFIIEEDTIWFVSCFYNVLFKMDRKTMVVVSIKDIPSKDILCTDSTSIRSIYKYNGYIYMLQNGKCNEIIQYDIQRDKMTCLNISFKNEKWGDYDDEDDEYLYLAIKDKNTIARWKKDNLKLDYIFIDDKSIGFTSVKKIKNGFVLVEVETGNIIIWDNKKGIQNIITQKPDNYYMEYDGYYQGIGVVYSDSKMLVFPKYANMCFAVDWMSSKVWKHGDNYKYEKVPLYTSAKKAYGMIWAYFNQGNKWQIFDKRLNIRYEYIPQFSDEVLKKLDSVNIVSEWMRKEKKPMTEYWHLTLNRYISSIAKQVDKT